jgi:ferredoxin
MKVRVEDNCTLCGMCVDICPEVFSLGDVTAEVTGSDISPESEELVQEAAEECPVEAIVIE